MNSSNPMFTGRRPCHPTPDEDSPSRITVAIVAFAAGITLGLYIASWFVRFRFTLP